MSKWSDFHEYVLPHVHGCPVGLANNAIRNAIIEFCEKSRLWTVDATAANVLAGVNRYSFYPPEGSRVICPEYVAINGTQLLQISLDDLDALHTGWRELEQEFPMWCYMDTDTSIRLVGTPTKDITGALEVSVALKPTRSSQECPDFIREDFAEVIAAGALSKLHAMVGRVWSNPQLVKEYRRQFRYGVATARSKSMKSRQSIVSLVKPRQFGDLFGM